MTVPPTLAYCDHGYCETEHCRTCEIMGACKLCEARSAGGELAAQRLGHAAMFKEAMRLGELVRTYEAALVKIAGTDYRGNRSQEQEIAWRALQDSVIYGGDGDTIPGAGGAL